MEFEVIRAGHHLGNVMLYKARQGQWAPTDDLNIQKGDVLKSADDGKLYEVIESNPEPYMRAGIYTRQLD